jgi:cytochrome c-type biogenesis protein CcmH/NrfG
VNADQLAELEEERRFLLKSLRDLDAELTAGDVDRHDYETLRDGYTKRAADVLREIEAGKAALPARRPRRWVRTAALVAAVVVIAVAVGIVAARSSGQRTSGQQMTGGAASGRQDVAALLANARALLGTDPLGAQDAYAVVLERDPDNPEALTYSAWLLYVVSAQTTDTALREEAVASAREQLARAVEVDPTYPDPHCFLAVIADTTDGDAATARAEADECLARDPPAEVRALVESGI